MLIFFDFPISLKVDITGCYQNAKLPMTQTGNQTRHISHTYACRRVVALCFKRKVDQNSRRSASDAQLPNCISTPISKRSGRIDFCNVWERRATVKNRTCSYVYESGEECPRKHLARGYCETHCKRWLRGSSMGAALGQGPEQHLPPQTGRIDAVQGHQAVGQAVVVDLNADQSLEDSRSKHRHVPENPA